MAYDRESMKKVFIGNLQREMNRKGWNQAETARRAQLFMPEGETIALHNINSYIRGRSIPQPQYLEALAKAFNVEPMILLPSRLFASTGRAMERERSSTPEMSVDETGILLNINRRVSFETGMKIMQLLKDES